MADTNSLASSADPQYFHAIVDMGSNGIRFSITSLEPAQARLLPTLYQHRAGISLYDAQFPPHAGTQRQPIDETTILAVLAALTRFHRVSAAFRVPPANIHVLATEATRVAINSEEFRRRILETSGWRVEMLSQADEGRIGALGVMSSLPDVNGLVMDLGGGSTQLSYLGSERVALDGGVGRSISLPYGAAALTKRLEEAQSRNGGVVELRREVKERLVQAYQDLRIPIEGQDHARRHGGFPLYLSGGGFRGWGYILMSRHAVSPYPIPIINGFRASREQFLGSEDVSIAAATALEDDSEEIFRVSDRRASQVPAVAFLVNAIAEALPEIREVRFCQGGVREGFLFASLPAEVRGEHPSLAATKAFQRSGSTNIAMMLERALPLDSSTGPRLHLRAKFPRFLLRAFANLIHHYSSHSKDIQASAALRSTTTGILSGVHGLSHESRTLIALLLCARWGGDVPPTDTAFKSGLEGLVDSPHTLWWIEYLGAVAALLATLYPAGIIGEGDPVFDVEGVWSMNDNGESVVNVTVFAQILEDLTHCEKEMDRIVKAGKKKRWIGGRDGIGYKVVVEKQTLQTKR